jgi:ferrous iron transport protein A
MPEDICTLDKLKTGESGIIVSFNEGENALKFMEMGCTPGEIVLLDSVAPLGDPIAVIVSGYKLTLRRSEASLINVQRMKS